MNLRYERIKAELTHPLRQKILRPHQALGEMAYPKDKEVISYHVGAFLEQSLVGIASLYPEARNGEINQGEWRLRGMAVDLDFQGQGIGRTLIKECVDYALTQKATSIWCNARTSALGFYKSLGFERLGQEFDIAGIGPHYVAQLDLKPSSLTP